MKGLFSWLRQAYSRLRESGIERVPVIITNQNGFNFTLPNQDQSEVHVLWENVVSVLVYKRDLLTFDRICVAFEQADGWVEVNEEMPGYDELLEAAERHLSGIQRRSEWYGEVMQPPFETCVREIWARRGHHPPPRQ